MKLLKLYLGYDDIPEMMQGRHTISTSVSRGNPGMAVQGSLTVVCGPANADTSGVQYTQFGTERVRVEENA